MTCPRNSRSLAAEAAFRARLEELGATLLEPEWLGSKAKHRAICAAGHLCTPTPHYVRGGDGICRTCGGHDPEDAERRFRARLAELGAELLESAWLGAQVKHRIRCAASHECAQKPMRVLAGIGACWLCSGRHPEAAEAQFRSRIKSLGGTCLYEDWRGVNAPHHVRCAAGHDAYPRPGGVNYGQGICRACAGTDPVSAEASFRALLRELGATPLWKHWRGNKAKHHVRCRAGHDCYPRPNDVQQGNGPCRECATAHSVFYVLEHDARPVVKFGISSGTGHPRLSKHRGQGYKTVHLLVADLPEGIARRAEDAVKSALAMAGERPVKGWEYFDCSCLALILDVADSWLSMAA